LDELANTEIEIKNITDRVTIAQYSEFYNVNAVSIALENFIVAVDSLLFPSQARKFREAVERRHGLPVKYLFVTHFHMDHYFGVAAYRDTTIFGSAVLKDEIDERISTKWTPDAFEKWKEDDPALKECIDEVELIPLQWGFDQQHVLTDGSQKLEFYHSGAHTGGSAYAYFPSERLIIAGDDLSSYDWQHMTEPSGSPDRWMSAFEHMLSLDTDMIIPGHGSPVNADHVREQLEFMKAFTSCVKEAVTEGRPPEELQLPKFYEPIGDWKAPMVMENVFNHYKRQLGL
jgi:glyoxylase-like metal-dependent hydrolase (beta-lactamase superfamily II)